MTNTAHTLRDDDGRYSVGFDAICRCGHPKGHHLAGRKGRSNGPCITHETPGGSEEMCSCEGFKKARR